MEECAKLEVGMEMFLMFRLEFDGIVKMDKVLIGPRELTKPKFRIEIDFLIFHIY